MRDYLKFSCLYNHELAPANLYTLRSGCGDGGVSFGRFPFGPPENVKDG